VFDISALLPVLFGLCFVAVVVVAFVLDRKRRDRLLQFCVARGWTYVDEDPSLTGRWTGEPFNEGNRRRARNVITGVESGRPFTAFDYSYETQSSGPKGKKTSSTHRFAVYAIHLPAFLPSLEVVPEGAFSRLAGAVGLVSDIDLESEDFNRKFRVKADDRKFATDVLSPRTMAYLLWAPPEAWRIQGTDIVRWQLGRLEPADVTVCTAILDRVADGIPAFVWKDHGYYPEP
jgi:hypothetical protein